MKKILLWILATLVLASCSMWPDDSIDFQSVIDGNPAQELQDKKTYLWFFATWCSHCQNEMPIVDKFYRQYKDEVNMQLFNIDGKYWPSRYIIPQDIKHDFSLYEELTWEACGSTPSFILYDEKWNLEFAGCGQWSLSFEDMEDMLLVDDLSTNTDSQELDSTYQQAGFQEWDLWVVMHTSMWDMTIKMFQDTPKTTNNFLALAERWYYDGLAFHRVIEWFMIQWWDPNWNGTGWESVYWPSFEDEFTSKLHNISWALSMANSWPNTNGSQFFINTNNNLSLDGLHTVFGQVVDWLEVAQNISQVETDATDRPIEPIVVESIDVVKYWDGELNPFEFSLEQAQVEQAQVEEARNEANKDRVVKVWDTIKINYIWKLSSDGQEFDNSYTKWVPLEFKVWDELLIKWIEDGVVGMKLWEKKTISISPEDGYGVRDSFNTLRVAKLDLQDYVDAWYKLEVWTKLPVDTGSWYLEIVDSDEDSVYIDNNHPLAWQNLTFEVELVWFVD